MNRNCQLIAAIDQVLVLRAMGNAAEPDPIHFALQAELAGAEGISAHLRVDRKYLSEEDVDLLNRLVKTRFYLKVSPHQDILHLVNGLRPHNVVLSAERREGIGARTGLDVTLLVHELKGIVGNIDKRQTRVFLSVEPDFDHIRTAAKLGVQGLVFNVRDLIIAGTPSVKSGALRKPAPETDASAAKKFRQLCDAVRLSQKFGMENHLAGGIRCEAIPDLVQVPGVSALHVGHQLVSRSLQLGVFQTVRSFLDFF